MALKSDQYETQFRSLSQSATDAIICADASDRITFWNRAAERIFGYTEAEVIGKPVTLLVPESYRTAHRNGVNRFLGTGETVIMGRTVEVQALRKGEFEFPSEISLSTWSADGEIFFTAIIRDISHRKEAELKLIRLTEESRRRKDELESLVQMVAHDLKSPALTIAGLAKALKKRFPSSAPDAKRDRILDQLVQSSESLERFLRDLLDGLALDAEKADAAPVDLREAAIKVFEEHEQELGERHIVFEMNISRSIPKVRGDEHKIMQVFNNLLTNAMRYMGQSAAPRITVHAVQAEDVVITSVSDTGIGIPPEYQRRIFDRFFRAPGSATRTGTGLGLHIVKKIIESFGGRVWVESEEGRGSVFRFSLPSVGAE